MFTQSYSCLPNKKQSIFGSQAPQNMGLLRSLTSKSYSKCEDSADHISMDFQASSKNISNKFGSRTANIMDLVYSFTESSKMKFNRRYISTFAVSPERSKLNCKEIITHCNTMTSLPLAHSYLVGGFVGSKSQLGRRRKNDSGKMNLWDIIRDLINLVGNSSANYPEKQNHHSPSSSDKKCGGIQNRSMQKNSDIKLAYLNDDVGLNGLDEPSYSLKQSYADVAKRPTRDFNSVIITSPFQSQDQSGVQSSQNSDIPVSVIESVSSCNRTNFSNRDRITSECSADSEDSFIVFECCDDDNIEKDIYSSDDETLSCFDEVSQSDSGIVPSNNSSYCGKPSSKKVRFAEGSNLVKVHPMVTWNFAYRMARRGPWEMLARDSERFKIRIAKTEAVLKPILDPQHRSVVFRERFCDLSR